MECPRCQVDIMIAERDGVETEVCPRCRGARLDPGELAELKVSNHSAAISAGEHDGRRMSGSGKELFSIAGEAFWGDELFDR